jgi:predicted outer membrane protein
MRTRLSWMMPVLWLAAGCAVAPPRAPAPPAEPPPPAVAPPVAEAPPPLTAGARATMTDAYVMGFVQAAHQAVMQEAGAARAKAVLDPVKAYAERLAGSHAAMQQAGARVLAALELQPAFSPRSREVQARHAAAMEQLLQQLGPAADAAFLDQTVGLHEHLLAKLDQAARDARHPEVKRLLEAARPELEGHLRDAQALRRLVSAGNGARHGERVPGTNSDR